jgi:SAM-dependent methyltransferase
MKTVSIDEEGFLISNGARLADLEFGSQILKNLFFEEDEKKLFSIFNGEKVKVEGFSYPLVARAVTLSDQTITVEFPYEVRESLDLKKLYTDDFDRFISISSNGIPFVFSRPAQAGLFELMDEFSDSSVTFKGQEYKIENYLISKSEVLGHQFWTNIYQTEVKPPWDLDGPHPSLSSEIDKLKLNKLRVLVLGCGKGHDAYHFSKRGHLVTGMDLSPTAIAQAKKLYPETSQLKFVCADAINPPKDFLNSFDLVFEHTLYCAVSPELRKPLVNSWRKFLDQDGYLMGFFWIFQRRNGPPYGSTEWEIRERLKANFRLLKWSRKIESPSNREGSELFVLGQLSSR